MPIDDNPFDPDAQDADLGAAEANARLRMAEQENADLKNQIHVLRMSLAAACRDLEEAQRSAQIARQLTMASLTETRDLCMPQVTKSLLYATVEALDFIAEDGQLPEEYVKARRRSIEQLERLDAKGVLTVQEQNECDAALEQGRVVVRYADIMRPRKTVSIEEAAEIVASGNNGNTRIVPQSNPARRGPGPG